MNAIQQNPGAFRRGVRARGFSLIELTSVAAIIGIVAAIAAPRMGNSVSHASLNAAALRIETDFALARRTAMAGSTDTTIVFGTGDYSIGGQARFDGRSGDYTVDLSSSPYSVTLVMITLPSRRVTFNMYGVPDAGGSITLGHGNHTLTLQVDAETGRVTRP